MADLITYDELIASLRLAPGDIDTQREADLRRSIKGASAAVASYADRAFASAVVTEQRTFEYDGSGFLDVDDCTNVTAVTFSYFGVDSVLDASEWEAQPYGSPVQTWIYLPARLFGGSPQMGFTRNLDVVARERGWMPQALIKVDATWGWPIVPDDVKQATIWTAAEMGDSPGAYRSESIADYSYSRDTPGLPEQQAIPTRAKDLLAPYVRYKIG